MKDLSFTILPIGYGENDANYNFCGYSFGDFNNKTPQSVWMKFPYFCVLVKHPKNGYFLFDTGPGLGAGKDRRSKESVTVNPATIGRDEYLDARLAQLCIEKSEINNVIISHTHWDHFGGLGLLHGSPALDHVYVNEKDFANGLVKTHRNACGYSDQAYFKVDFETEGVSYQFINEDQELFEGVELAIFEGHTPGVIGMILHCEDKTYIFPSDAVTSQINYGPPIVYPSMIADSVGFVKAVEKLRKLQKKYNAEIIFSHDPWQFKTLKTMPFFYR